MNTLNTGKDDPAVIRFMTAFHTLRDRIDDEPQGLLNLGIENGSVMELALVLADAAKALNDAERREPRIFTAPADMKFIDAWRDFERRYAKPVSDLGFYNIVGWRPNEIWKDGKERSVGQYEIEATSAQVDARSLNTAMDFAFQQASEEPLALDEDFVEEVLDGVKAWEKIAAQFGSDVAGVLRRRALVPFVLIPRHVSSHHGEGEKLSLLTHLEQAQTAFICGAPFAAVALMRSILEVTLREHYRSEGKDLYELINNCKTLPPSVSKETLRRLKWFANDILHFNKEKVSMPDDLEKDLLEHFFVLRALIEGAPEKKPSA